MSNTLPELPDTLKRELTFIFAGKYTRMYGKEDNSMRVESLIHADVEALLQKELARVREETLEEARQLILTKSTAWDDAEIAIIHQLTKAIDKLRSEDK